MQYSLFFPFQETPLHIDFGQLNTFSDLNSNDSLSQNQNEKESHDPKVKKQGVNQLADKKEGKVLGEGECFVHQKGRKPLKFREKDENRIFFRMSSKYQKSNKNFVKFLIKQFFTYCDQYMDDFPEEHKAHLQQVKTQIYKRGPKKICMKHLKMLLETESKGNSFGRINRKIIVKIFSSWRNVKRDIVFSHFIKHKPDKKQQLLATKIFKLRCRNYSLALRLQTR